VKSNSKSSREIEYADDCDWKIITGNDGKKYFWNYRTNETSWKAPAGLRELTDSDIV
jgi:hypothetical protein